MSEHRNPHTEMRALLARLCDGELDESGYHRIEELVHADIGARQLYIETLLLHSELQWTYSRSAGSPVAHLSTIGEEMELVTRLGENEATRRTSAATLSNSRRWRLRASVAAAAGIILAATWFLSGVGDSNRGSGSRPQVAVATLAAQESCVWSGEKASLVDGESLYRGQRLELERGLARLSFSGGATVLVESPAAVQMLSEKSLRLEHGSVAVRANGPVKDFVVVSPDATIVDLGTSFAVHYDETNATEVEVFEGLVEVFPESTPAKGHVLEMGTNASVGPTSDAVKLVATPPEESPFTSLLRHLWADLRAPEESSDRQQASLNDCVEAEFSDALDEKPVDAFYNTRPGRGWLTPWVATGNPTGEIVSDDRAFGLNNPYLNLRFQRSYERTIAREYGRWGKVDPSQPHVISWRWRLEGDANGYADTFYDRVAFYGNPFFRRNSWPTNSWLIGIAGADEDAARASESEMQTSNRFLRDTRGLQVGQMGFSGDPRRVFPRHWFFFNSNDNTAAGAMFDRRNMVDTGMELKFDVVYTFAVAVYPEQKRYDAAICDDKQSFVHTGMWYRNRDSEPANVFHAMVMTNEPARDLGFSLDSLHVQPLEGTDLRQHLMKTTGGKSLAD